MKFVASILFVYIMVLVALPAYQAFAETKADETCCSHCSPDSTKNQDGKDNQPTKSQDNPYSCNPFEVCTACIGFTVQLFPSVTSTTIDSSETVVFHYSELISEYISSIFQPPKIG